MRLEIRGPKDQLSEVEREGAERKVRLMLGRWAERLGRVVVRLEDVNGPKGGLDKRCRIEARLDRARSVIVEEVSSDEAQAVARAAERLASAVARAVAKERELGVSVGLTAGRRAVFTET